MTHHLVKDCHVEGPTCTIRLKDDKKRRKGKERKKEEAMWPTCKRLHNCNLG
jgi:hypothetical protein